MNYKIYYLSHVNYDPTAADLISIRVTIYLGPGKGGGGTGRQAGTGRAAGRYGREVCRSKLVYTPPPHMCNIHIIHMISCFTSKPHILDS